nr:hypothetical protein [Cupriavidus sp. EM10]
MLVHGTADAARQEGLEAAYLERPTQFAGHGLAQCLGILGAIGQYAGHPKVRRPQPLHGHRHAGHGGDTGFDLRAQSVGTLRPDAFARVRKAVEPDYQHGQQMGRTEVRAMFFQRGQKGYRLDGGERCVGR